MLAAKGFGSPDETRSFAGKGKMDVINVGGVTAGKASSSRAGSGRRTSSRSSVAIPARQAGGRGIRLLHRVFALEVLVCPRCAGPRRIVGAATEPHTGGS